MKHGDHNGHDAVGAFLVIARKPQADEAIYTAWIASPLARVRNDALLPTIMIVTRAALFFVILSGGPQGLEPKDPRRAFLAFQILRCTQDDKGDAGMTEGVRNFVRRRGAVLVNC